MCKHDEQLGVLGKGQADSCNVARFSALNRVWIAHLNWTNTRGRLLWRIRPVPASMAPAHFWSKTWSVPSGLQIAAILPAKV